MKIDDPKLTAYALDELPQDERESFAANLDADALKEIARIREAAGRIESALKSESMQPLPSKPARRDWRVVFAVAACIVLVGGVAFQMLRASGNHAREVAYHPTPTTAREKHPLAITAVPAPATSVQPSVSLAPAPAPAIALKSTTPLSSEFAIAADANSSSPSGLAALIPPGEPANEINAKHA